MSDVAFRPLSAAEKVFKDLIWDPMLFAGEKWLEGEVPVLALPVIRQIDEEAIQLIADWTFSQLVLFIDVTAIRLVNAEHQAEWDSASLKLRVVGEDYGYDSPEFLAAREEAKLALNRFVRLGPTA